MILDSPKQLLNECRQQGIVILAGAGVSAASAGSLPGWNPLNQAIFNAICDRVDSYLHRPDYTTQIRSDVVVAQSDEMLAAIARGLTMSFISRFARFQAVCVALSRFH